MRDLPGAGGLRTDGVGGRFGSALRCVAAALGLTPRSVRRLRASEAEPALVAAICLQMGFREAVGNVPERTTTSSAPDAKPEDVEAWFDALSPDERRNWWAKGSL